MEPAKGLEPPTHWLQISSSTNWATLAFLYEARVWKQILKILKTDAEK